MSKKLVAFNFSFIKGGVYLSNDWKTRTPWYKTGTKIVTRFIDYESETNPGITSPIVCSIVYVGPLALIYVYAKKSQLC
jgi:hypothetical protein